MDISTPTRKVKKIPEGIVLSLPQSFKLVASPCPASARLGEDVAELVIYTPLEAAIAYVYSERLYLAFYSWHGDKDGGRDCWTLAVRRTHPKFELKPELTLQLYPELQIVELCDGELNSLAFASDEARKNTQEGSFKYAQGVVPLEDLLQFAINNDRHFNPK